MKRAYYLNSIDNFLVQSTKEILGFLSSSHTHRLLEEQQLNAWTKQIEILKDHLQEFKGQIYFEFVIPRMGKRVDNILIICDTVFIVEFKVGSNNYDNYHNYAIDQVIDYTLDLKNFHEGSHNTKLIPVLISTDATVVNNENDYLNILAFKTAVKVNKDNIGKTLNFFIDESSEIINWSEWENSIYKPTPTIVEAAQALYKGHNVKEISRSDAGAYNLTITSDCINEISDISKQNNFKSILFVTGVPGAGKTLAGLNIATERMKTSEDEHAVFLSGNGPLVSVLREALTRDEVKISKVNGNPITKRQAAIKTNAFIQNIHHFRDDNLLSEKAPIEKVVVFDEAQRAWSKNQTSSFMKRKKGKDDFNKSEPEFLIEVMNRHSDWCSLICLIGGGQEINTGEAGLEEWIRSLKSNFPNWNIYYSYLIVKDLNYLNNNGLINWLKDNAYAKNELHLSVSVRSFRTEKLAEFVEYILATELEKAQITYKSINDAYPICLTRDLLKAKEWIKSKAKGSERYGIISSSSAKRLRPLGIDVRNEISPPYWFLNDKKNDVRSSYYLEDIATEFDIQGLEIDWSIVAWDGNFYLKENEWHYQNFKGTKWQKINKQINKNYLKNSYRVLLTRARQGMVIFIPESNNNDFTRPNKFYDGTYNFFKKIGIKEI